MRDRGRSGSNRWGIVRVLLRGIREYPTVMDKQDCLALLYRTLSELLPDGEEELVRVDEYCTVHTFEARAHLHEAGEVVRNAYFICAGLVRFYYVTQDGREHNKSFAAEGQFAGALQSSGRPEPVRYFIQALEPTRTLTISLEGLDHLYAHSLVWANVGRLLMESLAVRKARREGAFLLDSAEERYRCFMEEQPALAQRLPLYHIASYLGVTDVGLSRIRRRLQRIRSI